MSQVKMVFGRSNGRHQGSGAMSSHRAGIAGCPGATVVTNARAFYLLGKRLRVQWPPGIPHAHFGAKDSSTTRA
jgi:hypothetical protein